jgi:hypothetical protein
LGVEPGADRFSDDDDKEDRGSTVVDIIERVTVQLVHGAVKAVTKGGTKNTETLRIFFNVSKVSAHLYATLSYCLHFPKAMNDLLAVASVFALDLVSETRMPCTLTGFTYFDRVKIAIFAPLALIVMGALVGVLWAAQRHKKRRANRITVTPSALEMERARGSSNSVIKTGLWKAAGPLIFALDLCYPTITRVLWQLNTCRDLGSSGWWLEADYSIKCSNREGMDEDDATKLYDSYLIWARLMAVVYSFGIPALFYILLRTFRERARAGDRLVRGALSWMYTPYRRSYEWYVFAAPAFCFACDWTN